MRPSLVLLTTLILPLIGGKGSCEKEAVGSWVSAQGMKLTVAEDKSYKTRLRPPQGFRYLAAGGRGLRLRSENVNGQAVSEVKSRLEKYLPRIAEGRRPLVEKMLRDIDRPNDLTLSSDGKTFSTDPTKDKNESPWTPLTKR